MFSTEGNSPNAQRKEMWEKLRTTLAPEVLIIGGGVNGIGLLRDLALNNVSATLIDSGDFCSGASSASSRMAHGGLRYLEGREFDLVRESARERNMLLHDAAHLVKPLEVVVPVRHWIKGLPRTALRFFGLSGKSGPLSFVALKSGLLAYERFGAIRRALPHHNVAIRRSQFPAGLPRPVRSVISYYDGQIVGPEALMFEMLSSAVQQENVAAINHISWRYSAPGKVEITNTQCNDSVVLTPKIIVNAAGSAIDKVNQQLGLETHYVRGVKGAHLVLRHPALQQRMAGRSFYFDDGHGRMVVSLPVEEVILIGTTEVETEDPGDRQVSSSEVDYLLNALNSLFDDIRVQPEHIVAVTSGIRPLQASEGSATQAARDHALQQNRAGEMPVLSLVGGKWTTFRAFAELAANTVLQQLKRPRQTTTLGLSYPGAGELNLTELADSCGLSLARVRQLYTRYGTLAKEVADFCGLQTDRPLTQAESYSQREIIWLTQRRMALSLEDMILRRTNIVMTGQLTKTTLADIARVMAQTLGYDETWAETQTTNCAADPRIIWNGR